MKESKVTPNSWQAYCNRAKELLGNDVSIPLTKQQAGDLMRGYLLSVPVITVVEKWK